MDLACNYEVCSLLLVEAVKIWNVLEVVGIELSALYYLIWLYIVVKYCNLKVVTLLLECCLGILEDLCVWCC